MCLSFSIHYYVYFSEIRSIEENYKGCAVQSPSGCSHHSSRDALQRGAK